MQLHRTIEASPAGLEAVYERLWAEILDLPIIDKDRAVNILRWVAFAVRPLTVAEITEALLTMSHESFDIAAEEDRPNFIDDDYIASELGGLCGSFIEVQGADRNQGPGLRTILKHFSARGFLLSSTVITELLEVPIDEQYDQAVRNNHLAIAILRFLRSESVSSAKKPADTYPFFNYAVQSWYIHVSSASSRYSTLDQIASNFFPDKYSRLGSVALSF